MPDKKTARKKKPPVSKTPISDAILAQEPITRSASIYQRMNNVMKEISYVQKDGTVTIRTAGGSFSYKAVSHDAVTTAIRQAIVDNGIVVQITVPEHTASADAGGYRLTELKVQARFINIDNPSEYIEYSAIGHGMDRGDKGPGKALSYAVKYIYLKAFLLATGEDDEAAVHLPDAVITAEQLLRIEDLLDSTDTEGSTFADYINGSHALEIKDMKELPRRLYPFAESKLVSKLNQMPSGEPGE
jgi:hypothetical protein